jgi:hypothetical protein
VVFLSNGATRLNSSHRFDGPASAIPAMAAITAATPTARVSRAGTWIPPSQSSAKNRKAPTANTTPIESASI